MKRVGLAGTVKIELPDRTIRYCDGGFIEVGGEFYFGRDAVYGSIGALKTMKEGVGTVVPALTMILLPPDTTAPVDISKPGNQTARVTFSIAEYDADSGLVSTSDVFFSGQIDQTNLTDGENTYELAVSVVSLAERLFERNIGNTMNPTWHKTIHPGERGQDNATGLGGPLAWGTEKPVSGLGGSGGNRGGTLGPGFGATDRQVY